MEGGVSKFRHKSDRVRDLWGYAEPRMNVPMGSVVEGYGAFREILTLLQMVLLTVFAGVFVTHTGLALICIGLFQVVLIIFVYFYEPDWGNVNCWWNMNFELGQESCFAPYDGRWIGMSGMSVDFDPNYYNNSLEHTYLNTTAFKQYLLENNMCRFMKSC